VSTASGLSRLAAVEPHTLRDGLAQVLASIRGYTVVHCCAATVPFGIIREAGAGAVSFDLSQLRRGEEDAVAEVAEAGMGQLIGAVPTVAEQAAAGTWRRARAGPATVRGRRSGPGGGSAEARKSAERVIRLWRRLGLSLTTCAQRTVITPACGLAGSSPAQARAVLTRCREAASMLPELIEEAGASPGERAEGARRCLD